MSISEDDIRKHINDMNLSDDNDDGFMFIAVCKKRGLITYDIKVGLCDDEECYWCRSISDGMKKEFKKRYGTNRHSESN